MREFFAVVCVGLTWVQVLAFELNANCTENSKYFDTSLMECASCPSDQTPSSDGLSCICIAGYAKSLSTRDLPVFTCEQCAIGSVPSSDHYLCQTCENSISNNECTCTGSYEVLLEFSANGDYLVQKQCFDCGVNAYPGPNNYQCEKCPDVAMTRSDTFDCTCPATSYTESFNSCLKDSEVTSITNQYSVSNAVSVTYQFLENAQGLGTYSISTSSSFQFYYLKAADDCMNYQSIKGCQILANLCVMQLYNERTTVCQLFNFIGSTRNYANSAVLDSGWKENMPWLYYSRSANEILTAGNVVANVTFDPNDSNNINLMVFQIATFSVDGTFEGFTELSDQLILCPHSLEDSKNFREFGTNVIIDCDLNLTSFVSADKNKFYDLYYVDQDGTLLDVPVLIQNLMLDDGSLPNQSQDSSLWALVRRFFIYDNISGIEGENGYTSGIAPKIIQYLRSAKIRFTLRSDKEQRIYIPYLILNYRARETLYIDGTDSTDHITFQSEYGMDTSKFWTIAKGIFIGSNVIVLLCWAVRLYVWTKINPQKDSPTTYTRWVILTGFRMLITTWGFIHFWYLFSLTGYWFIFYKLQYHVYALVPPLTTYTENYYPFEVVLALVITACIFNAVYNVYHQVNLDLILIDWEKPNRSPISNQAIGEEIPVYKEYVSAWRYLFIVNELNELQSQRYISVEFTFFLFLFFIDGLGWDELSTAQPNSNVGYLNTNTSPRNPVLHYFLTCSLLLIIGYTQFVLRKVLSNWIATPIQNFIDLCSVSNISVLVLDEYLHGYYIHGVSPNGFSELSIDELLESLNKEASGKSRPRGILPEDKSGLQTFEVFIPTAIRKTYNNLARQPVESGINEYKEGLKEASGLPSVPKSLPENMSIKRVQEIRLELNRRLKIYIAGLVKDSNTQILDKSALQRFLRMPPVDLSLLDGTPYFYRDPSIGFESSFLMGKEFSFLLMDIMLFELFEFTIGNTYVSVLLAYIISKLISYIRQVTGEWNLSRKSLVNQRFLL